jgi:molybdopterin-guanine dinucleotide biosynthesis protein A
MANEISAAILSGGLSSRMGINKAFVTVGNKPIIERVIERLRRLTDDLILITNTQPDYQHLGLPFHSDLIPGKGPLGGLYTAISMTRNKHTLVVSCDQPFLNVELLNFLITLRSDFDVIVPLAEDGYPQSMHAIYGKGCLDPIRANLEADRLKMISFFPSVKVREVSGPEIEVIDPQRISFFNVNTPEALAEANTLAPLLD